jgi:cytochrome P450
MTIATTDPLQVLRRVLLREPYVFPEAEMDRVRLAGPSFEPWPGTYALVGYELSRAVLREPCLVVEDSRAFGERFPRWREHVATRSFMRELLSVNGETHRQLREVLSQAFVPPGKARMQHIVSATVLEIMSGADEALRQGLEVILEPLCSRIPLLSIGRLLGLPDDMAEFMAARSDTFSDLIRCNFMSRRRLLDADVAVREMQDAVRHVIAADEVAPAGLLADLLRQRTNVPDALDEEGLLANVILLYSAGYDTTRSLIGHALRTLAGDPSLVRDLRSEQSRLIRFIREIERLHPPIPLTSRFAQVDVAVGDHHYPAGSHVFVLIDAANRDPAVAGELGPHQLSYTGHSSRSLSFGAGARTCLGLPMARALTEATLAHVLAEWPDVALLHDAVSRSVEPAASVR